MLKFFKFLFSDINSTESKPDSEEIRFEGEPTYENAIAHYKAHGFSLLPPASEKELESIENITKFKFPEDFKEFYRLCNGYEDYESNEFLFSLWSINRIKKEYLYPDNEFPEYIPFCDFLINSHQLGYINGKKGIFKSYDFDKPIADNYREFITLLLKDSELLY